MSGPYYGHATRAVSSPIASGQRGRFSQPTKFLPLSQFFLQQGEPPDGKVIYGRQEPPKKKAAKDVPKALKQPQGPPLAQEEGPKGGPWNKPHKCKYCDAPATRDLIWADGRAYIPVCQAHRKKGEHQILVKNKDSIAAAKPVVQEESFEDFCDYGGGHFSAFLKRHPRYDTEEFRDFVACKNKGDRDSGELDDLVASEVERLAQAFEGITTTANVPTVPVPIGGGDGRRFLDRPGDKKKKKKRSMADGVGLLLRRLF